MQHIFAKCMFQFLPNIFCSFLFYLPISLSKSVCKLLNIVLVSGIHCLSIPFTRQKNWVATRQETREECGSDVFPRVKYAYPIFWDDPCFLFFSKGGRLDHRRLRSQTKARANFFILTSPCVTILLVLSRPLVQFVIKNIIHVKLCGPWPFFDGS